MLKMAVLLATLFFLYVSVAGQELLQISSLDHHDSTPEALQSISHTMGVSMDEGKLDEVSTSILMAEKWLRTHVLSRYPSTNITTIVVSNRLLCSDKSFEDKEEISRLTLVTMENVYHSLVRWGLERRIKVSVLITTKCLHQSYLKPVFKLLEEINSTYTMKTHDFSDETVGILSSHLKSVADLGVFQSKTLNVISTVSKQEKPRSRKLSFIDPTSEVGYSVPSDAATTPLPPLIGVTSPPPLSLPFAPQMQPPMTAPAYSPPPHYGVNLPPCNPYPSPHHGGRGSGAMAAPPLVGDGGAMAAPPLAHQGLWCVAKPSVPSEKLQEAMDYACGEGGADCDPISPTGSCYFPDSIVAHASYAFNSYWQKNKKNGGTCGFGGTAMLINSDPSFLHCHFTLE
ncbi:hypothetical protein L1887_31457 [Cichorium endivia]|nr:hypothetical protein L1887_31457 [Cichorium endivia]